MNDAERELRELFEEKARDARTVHAAPPAVLKRGRRRQVGTVAIGATTAILVAVASIAVLRVVGPGRATTPASNDLGERTATIQNFTVTAPAGWTLIDWGPISRYLATSKSSSGGPVVSSTTASLADVVPVLQVSNFDPGLDPTSSCSSSGELSARDATLYVAADVAAIRTAAGPLLRPPWPVPLDGNGAPQSGPCGNGYYARFSLHGYPYFAFVGFGSNVDGAVRQQTLDIFTSLSADNAGLTYPSGSIPGYVMAVGSQDGVPWSLELGIAPLAPTASSGRAIAWITVVSGSVQVAGLSQVSGPAGVDDALMWLLGTGGLVTGSVHAGADQVEYVAPDGTASTASILSVPDGLRSAVVSRGGVVSDRIFWVSGDPANVGQIVQFVDGAPTTEYISLVTAAPTAADRVAQAALRNALVAALTHYTDHASYVGFTPAVAESIEPTLTYNMSSTTVSDEVSIRDVSASTVLLVTSGPDGSVWCIADDQARGTTTYGTVDAQTAAECVGGDAAWAIGSTKDTIGTGRALGDTWTLKASLNPSYCTELDFGGRSWDGCVSQPVERVGPDADRPSSEYLRIVPGGALYVESVPTAVVSIEVRAASGAVFTGTCLAAPAAYGPVRYCVVGLEGEGQGTVHFLAADGSEPFRSYTIDWTRQTAAGSLAP